MRAINSNYHNLSYNQQNLCMQAELRVDYFSLHITVYHVAYGISRAIHIIGRVSCKQN